MFFLLSVDSSSTYLNQFCRCSRLLQSGTQALNLACGRTVNDFVTYADCHTTEEAGVNLRVDGHHTTINLAQLLGEYCLLAFVEFTRANNVCKIGRASCRDGVSGRVA